MNNPEDITVISHTWKSTKMHEFFNGLQKNNTFGFSKSFTIEEITEMASSYGVRVRPLPKNDPNYKKYGEWMLKVSSIRPAPDNRSRTEINLGNLKIEKIRNDEVCDNCKCHMPKGKKTLISRNPGKIKRNIDKKYYCRSCGLDTLSNTLNNLVILLKILS